MAGNIIGATVAVRGLGELQRALKHAEGELPKHLRKELREIGEVVKDHAEGNIHSRSGRLAGSIKIADRRNVSVYSNLVYSRVQDQGGRVGRGHATILSRSDVSQYMRKGVSQAEGEVQGKLNDMLDKIERDFGG